VSSQCSSCPEFPVPQFIGTLYLLTFAFLITSCGDPTPPQQTAISLSSSEFKSQWHASGIPEQGPTEITEGVLRIGEGFPMTGIRFVGDWEALNLPWIDYALTFEARRVEGQDFFATCTFPVGGPDRCVSLVVGGWGGGLVGISCIDQLDASENNTRGEMAFNNGTWYQFRIEVREDDLQVWINGAPMVNVSIKGRQLSLRSGEIDTCVPLGFATWRTVGEIRSIVVQRL
jgi:hypothetical protein